MQGETTDLNVDEPSALYPLFSKPVRSSDSSRTVVDFPEKSTTGEKYGITQLFLFQPFSLISDSISFIPAIFSASTFTRNAIRISCSRSFVIFLQIAS